MVDLGKENSFSLTMIIPRRVPLKVIRTSRILPQDVRFVPASPVEETCVGRALLVRFHQRRLPDGQWEVKATYELTGPLTKEQDGH